jgi:osmoprotectant transport system permease protein
MLDATVPVVGTPLLVEDVLQYLTADLVQLTLAHLVLVVQSIVLAVPIGVTLGVLITFDDTAATLVLWLAGIMMTIPSIALFGLLIPAFGIGTPPVIVALVLYSQLPVIRNTYVGLTQVDPAAIEAGTGLGMTRVERLRRIQLPMALPVIMAGVRNAVVILIGIAAIGAFIGATNLGEWIFNGISEGRPMQIVVATVALSLLTLAIDYCFGLVERYFRARNGEDVDLPRLFDPVVPTGDTA